MRAALYLRISSDRQDAANQELQVRALVTARGYTLDERHVYRVTEKGDAATNTIKDACRDAARRGQVDVIVVWALDRWTRQGITDLVSSVAQLRRWGCALVSVQEPWADTSDGGSGELMLAIAGWTAQQEKRRLSERNRATAARLKAELATRGRLVSKRGVVFTALGRPRVDVSPRAQALALQLRAQPGQRYGSRPTGWPAVAAAIEAQLGERYAPATLARSLASKSGAPIEPSKAA